MDCCTPSGYGRFFNQRQARRDLRHYRRRGLGGTARDLASFLTERGVGGHTVMEVGGGVGALHVELLKAGAARAISVEISPEYEAVARELLEEEGLAGRVERHVADFATEAARFGGVDDVVMNRVLCCYPHVEKLMDAALGRARRYLAASFPRDRRLTRMVVRLSNWVFRVRRIDFQAYVHRPADILAAAARRGFTVAFDDHDLIWRVVVFEKTG